MWGTTYEKWWKSWKRVPCNEIGGYHQTNIQNIKIGKAQSSRSKEAGSRRWAGNQSPLNEDRGLPSSNSGLFTSKENTSGTMGHVYPILATIHSPLGALLMSRSSAPSRPRPILSILSAVCIPPSLSHSRLASRNCLACWAFPIRSPLLLHFWSIPPQREEVEACNGPHLKSPSVPLVVLCPFDSPPSSGLTVSRQGEEEACMRVSITINEYNSGSISVMCWGSACWFYLNLSKSA
jgi:hypothetical protein